MRNWGQWGQAPSQSPGRAGCGIAGSHAARGFLFWRKVASPLQAWWRGPRLGLRRGRGRGQGGEPRQPCESVGTPRRREGERGATGVKNSGFLFFFTSGSFSDCHQKARCPLWKIKNSGPSPRVKFRLSLIWPLSLPCCRVPVIQGLFLIFLRVVT